MAVQLSVNSKFNCSQSVSSILEAIDVTPRSEEMANRINNLYCRVVVSGLRSVPNSFYREQLLGCGLSIPEANAFINETDRRRGRLLGGGASGGKENRPFDVIFKDGSSAQIAKEAGIFQATWTDLSGQTIQTQRIKVNGQFINEMSPQERLKSLRALEEMRSCLNCVYDEASSSIEISSRPPLMIMDVEENFRDIIMK